MTTSVPTANADLLLVDDDADYRDMTARYLRKHGFYVEEADGGESAIATLEKRHFCVIILDISMPGMDGIEVLKKLNESASDAEVIVLSGAGTVKTAVEAMKLGARDFITKPVNANTLLAAVKNACEKRRLRMENRLLRTVIARTKATPNMVGQSHAMKEVFRLVQRTGPTDKPVLIQGESGTGKELVAEAIHHASSLSHKPMIVINCAALPENLLESELFGHEKGAFTGASSAKPGLFEIADGGTLFIDEIGELASSLQAKLLRVLEDGSLRRVGSLVERKVKVRLISATNRNLETAVKDGKFREDLYYRIDVMTLTLPPLRERPSDIPLLVMHFAGEDWQIESAAMKALQNYDWPGNVRQLINAIERAKILADDDVIRLQNLPDAVGHALDAEGFPDNLEPITDWQTYLGNVQKSHIADAISRENGNKSRAARALGVSRRTLYRLLDKYEI